MKSALNSTIIEKKQVNLERRQIGMSRHINVTDF